MNLDILLISIIIGVICCLLFLIVYLKVKTSKGVFVVDYSNPEKDIYRIELDNLDNITSKKYVILKIDDHSNLFLKSHEREM